MSILLPKAAGSGPIRLGIMGGTFDPIHMGHLVTAEEARQQFNLDWVVFVPSGKPPHKDQNSVINAEHRYLMTMLAVITNPYFTVSRVEIDKKDPSYTYDTIQWFHSYYNEEAEIFFITGADAVLDLPTWKDYRQLLERCQFVAATRPGYSLQKLADNLKVPDQILNRIHMLQIPAIAISSTDIRQRVRQGKTIKYLTTEAVEHYIRKNHLYRP